MIPCHNALLAPVERLQSSLSPNIFNTSMFDLGKIATSQKSIDISRFFIAVCMLPGSFISKKIRVCQRVDSHGLSRRSTRIYDSFIEESLTLLCSKTYHDRRIIDIFSQNPKKIFV